MTMIHRRHFLAATGAASLAPTAWAQFKVEISGVGANQIPIAIPKFRDEDRSAQPISRIVRDDLERSGYFRSVDTGGAVMDESASPNFSDWRGRTTDALAAGSAMRLADGRYDVRYRLWDVVKGQALSGHSFAVASGDLRLAAHRVADAVYEELTGEKGIFSTRIAYVTKGGGKRKYTLWVADADGEAAVDALGSEQPIISPAWSPKGDTLAYVSFENGKAEVFVHDVARGSRHSVASFKGSNSAPAWSPDGQQLALTLSREGGSQLFVMDRAGGNVRRLTSSSSIDTEAVWAPDGRSIYFVSDRGGAPQVYRVSSGGGNAERVTFQGGYNISPSVSPDGKSLAYVTRAGGAFKLQLLDLARGSVTGLTDTSDDESPSFAPNGKLIMYATRAGGRDILMTTTLDGKIKARLASPRGADVREPAWGPFAR